MKTCTRCRTPKPLSEFVADRRASDGRTSQCRVCDRKRCRDRHYKVRAPEPEPEFKRPLASKRRYIITSAQNNTLVHSGLLESLKVAAARLNAELVVVPYRYKNPTGMQPGRDLRAEGRCGVHFRGARCLSPRGHDGQHKVDELWWDPTVEPYLFNGRKKLHEHLVLAADVKIQATAVSPLTGFESLTGAESCIIGHPKMQFRTVPVPTGRFPKILTTTGTCTQRNYSNTKAGALGEFHHYLGALLVEISGAKFHIRQLNADRETGGFIDLDTSYAPDGFSKAPPALGLVMGDTHADFIDPKVDKATFGPKGIVEVLDPETLVFEDVLDGYSHNPHHLGNPFIARGKYLSGLGNVQAEVKRCVDFLAKRIGSRKAILVSSNHNDFLERWVLRADWKTDPPNALFYLETAKAMLESVRMTPAGTEYADPFAYWVARLSGLGNVRCLGPDESFKLAEIECGMHGHRGPNGAKGTLRNLGRLGSRVISGHTHSPGIEEGHYQVGTSTPLRLEYTHGPSSWLNTHCVVYANGKRALITIIDGSWRL